MAVFFSMHTGVQMKYVSKLTDAQGRLYCSLFFTVLIEKMTNLKK